MAYFACNISSNRTRPKLVWRGVASIYLEIAALIVGLPKNRGGVSFASDKRVFGAVSLAASHMNTDGNWTRYWDYF